MLRWSLLPSSVLRNFRSALRATVLLPRYTAIALITLYQATLSPDHGLLKHLHPYGFCRHTPTCSEHGKHVLAEHGFVIGCLLLLCRTLSCHPWRRPSDAKLLTLLR